MVQDLPLMQHQNQAKHDVALVDTVVTLCKAYLQLLKRCNWAYVAIFRVTKAVED